MGWNSRGLRGSTLEDAINITNDYYKNIGLAVIQKVPTPITPVQIDKTHRTITLAYFEKQSTVDYIGVVQGIPVCFDAKDTTRKSLPIAHIHEHQIDFMRDFQKQEGLSFLLVHFVKMGDYFFLPFQVLEDFYKKSQNNGRKSIPYEAFVEQAIKIELRGAYIHYLDAIKHFLENGD